MRLLTRRQDECLRVIVRYISQNGYAPTRRELASLLSQSSRNGVNQMLAALCSKGYIRLEPQGQARNIVLVKRAG